MVKIYCINGNGNLVRNIDFSSGLLMGVFDVSESDVMEIMSEIGIYGVEDDMVMLGVDSVEDISLEMWLERVSIDFGLKWKC